MFINDAKKNLEQARQWLDFAMYFCGDTMPDKELEKTREAYNSVCHAIDKL